ncbi:MAG: Calx-beta domain-containing protein, partial [Pseudomonadota bacterium]
MQLLVFILMLMASTLCSAFDFNFRVELGAWAHDGAFDENQNRVYISIPDLNQVVVIDISNASITNRINLGAAPKGIDLSSDNSKLFVALDGVGAVAVINTGDLSISNTISVAEALDSVHTLDVLEAAPNLLFASSSDKRTSHLARIELGDEIVVTRAVSGYRFDDPIEFARRSDGVSLFLWENDHGNDYRIYNLDISSKPAVIAANSIYGELSYSDHLVLSPDNQLLITSETEIVDATSLAVIKTLERAANAFDTGTGKFYRANSNAWNEYSVEEYNLITDQIENSKTVPCEGATALKPNWFAVEDKGEKILLASSNFFCGTYSVDPATTGWIWLKESHYEFDENSPSEQVEICRGGGSAGAITVDVTATDGSASVSSDYLLLQSQVNFSADEAGCESLDISLVDNFLSDGNKTFEISIASNIGSTNILRSRATVVIVDDEPLDGPFKNALIPVNKLLTDGVGRMVLDRSNNRLYVGNNKIEIFEFPRLTPLGEIETSGYPAWMTLDEAAQRMYVSLQYPSRVAVVDLTSQTLEREIDVSNELQTPKIGFSVSPVTNRLIVSGYETYRDFQTIADVSIEMPPFIVDVDEQSTNLETGPFARLPGSDEFFGMTTGFPRAIGKYSAATNPIQFVSRSPLGIPRINRLFLEPNGERLYTEDGLVIDTETMLPVGYIAELPYGIPDKIVDFFNHTSEIVVAEDDDIKIFDRNTLLEKQTLNLPPCDRLNYLEVDRDGYGLVVANYTRLCALAGNRHGFFHFEKQLFEASEADIHALPNICRASGSEGPASVELMTLTGQVNDFTEAMPGTHYESINSLWISFEDGESGCKSAEIPLLNDNIGTAPRAFRLTINDVIGGGESVAYDDSQNSFSFVETVESAVLISDDDADVAIAELNSEEVYSGESIEFTVTVANNSPGPDTVDITVTSEDREDFIVSSISSNSGTCSAPAGILCDFVEIQPGEVISIDVTARLVGSGEFSNIFSIEVDGPDSNPLTNSTALNYTIHSLPTSNLLAPLIPGATANYQRGNLLYTKSVSAHPIYDIYGVQDSDDLSSSFFNSDDGLYEHGTYETTTEFARPSPPLKTLNYQPNVGDVVNQNGFLQIRRIGVPDFSYPFTSTST